MQTRDERTNDLTHKKCNCISKLEHRYNKMKTKEPNQMKTNKHKRWSHNNKLIFDITITNQTFKKHSECKRNKDVP